MKSTILGYLTTAFFIVSVSSEPTYETARVDDDVLSELKQEKERKKLLLLDCKIGQMENKMALDSLLILKDNLK